MAPESTSKGGRRPLRLGKYEVLGHIGSGGMGTVYRAQDVDLKRQVALKILSPELAVKPAMLERFRREARSAAKLRHENIVALYDFSEANGTYFLVLEYVEGVDLQDHISRKGKLAPDEARHILIQAVRALDHAYKQGIVHRDIKPSNFLITTKNDQVLVKLTDLGLAREVRDDEHRVTRDGTTVGTVDYMSPEQARNSAAADIRSDIYSLGCTFYHMLGGCCPFPTGSLTERIYQHVEADPPDIRRLNGEVPQDLVVILSKMLAKKPTDRYQTPLELLKDLESPESLQIYLGQNEGLANLADLAAEEVAPHARVPSTPETPEADVDADVDEEVPRVRKGGAGKKMFRDKAPPAATDVKSPLRKILAYWPAALGVAGVVLAVVVTISQMRGTPRPRKNDPIVVIPPPKPPVVPIDSKKPEDTRIPDPEVKEPPEPKFVLVGPNPDELPALYQPRLPFNRTQLRAEFYGPFPFPLPEDDKPATLRVCRAPMTHGGPETFRSLADAWSQIAPGRQTIIDIHDQGPLFVPALPHLENCEVILRAAPGYRPLVAWDLEGPAKAGNGSAGLPRQGPFLSMAHGRLVLQDIDIVLKWQDNRAEEAGCLFKLQDVEFIARRCTFSQAGKHRRGVVAVQLDPDDKKSPPSCRFNRCYFRGADLTAVKVGARSAEVLMEGCLLVGGTQPLVAVTATEGSPKVRVIRSTLVAGSTLLQYQGAGEKAGFRWLAWDALLARSDPISDGALVQTNGELRPETTSWRAVNCYYAGWRQYLAGGPKTIAKLADWHGHWHYTEGDRDQVDPWPRRHAAEPEEIPAEAYCTDESPALFAATSASGALGYAAGAIPPGPERWLRRTYDRYVLPLVALPDPDAVPAISTAADGLYHGEALDVNRIDLGQYLQTRLGTMKPGPHVVLRLSGAGEQATSPIRFKGIGKVTLYVEPPKDKAPPLVLVPHPKTVRDRDGLIEVEDGDLELLGVRIQFENTRFATMAGHMLKVRNGDLVLQRCWLQGPLSQGPEYFQALIRFEALPGKEQPPSLVVHESILIGKSVAELRGSTLRLRAKQNVGLAAKDVFHLDVRAPVPPGIHCLLEQNTLAFRESLFNVRADAEIPTSFDPLLIQATANLFADPFVDAPRRSSLLRCDPATLTRGLLVWQGRGNAFDHKRLHAYAVAPSSEAPEKQSFQVWAQTWGSPGEIQPLLATLPETPKHTFKLDQPQLEKLAWPATFRPRVGETLPGASLVRLGILKK